jgi:hypothetical protein
VKALVLTFVDPDNGGVAFTQRLLVEVIAIIEESGKIKVRITLKV